MLGMRTVVVATLYIEAVVYRGRRHELPNPARSFWRKRQRVEAAFNQCDCEQTNRHLFFLKNSRETIAVLFQPGANRRGHRKSKVACGRELLDIAMRRRIKRGSLCCYQTKQLIYEFATIEPVLGRDTFGLFDSLASEVALAQLSRSFAFIDQLRALQHLFGDRSAMVDRFLNCAHRSSDWVVFRLYARSLRTRCALERE